MKKTFYFIRHGQKADTPGINDLTDYGRTEICKLTKRIRLSTKNAVYRTVNNFYSKATAVLLDNPNTLDILQDMEQMEAIGKIQVCNFLDYKDPSVDGNFHQYLRDAHSQKRVLEFMVNKSDYISNGRKDLSTYTTASNDFTDNILQDVNKHSSDHIVYIGREALITSFRARVTEVIKGVEEMHQYVDWYENNIECDENCDKLNGILVAKPGSGRQPYWRWSDAFGDIYFYEQDIIKFKK